MTLSQELKAFAFALQNALAEGAHLLDAGGWIEAVENHFAAQTPAPVAEAEVAPAPLPVIDPPAPEPTPG